MTMEDVKANVVVPVQGEVIPIEKVDFDMLVSWMNELADLRQLIGLETERHHAAIADLLSRVEQAKSKYGTARDVVFRKYSTQLSTGRYEFRPDLGGFLFQGEKKDG